MTRPPPPARPAPPPLPPEVQQALQAGQTIEAIRRLRAATGLGVREAKARIDAARAGQPRAGSPPPSQRHGPVEEPGWRARPGWGVVLVVALVLLGWWFAQQT